MEFKCSGCGYLSDRKQTVEAHIDKKKNCNFNFIGLKTVIATPVDIKCKFCNKDYAVKSSLDRHIKKCKERERLERIQLEMAVDQLKNEVKDSKKIMENLANDSKKMIENLAEKISKLESKELKTNIINNNYGVINNNNTVNNYIDTPKLSDKKINEIIIKANEADCIIPDYFKEKHCNPGNPENINVYINNKSKNNTLMLKRVDNQWIIVNKKYEIRNIITDKETELDDWVDNNKKIYPKAAKIYESYKDNRHEDNFIVQTFENVELMLYNIRKYAIKI